MMGKTAEYKSCLAILYNCLHSGMNFRQPVSYKSPLIADGHSVHYQINTIVKYTSTEWSLELIPMVTSHFVGYIGKHVTHAINFVCV